MVLLHELQMVCSSWALIKEWAFLGEHGIALALDLGLHLPGGHRTGAARCSRLSAEIRCPPSILLRTQRPDLVEVDDWSLLA